MKTCKICLVTRLRVEFHSNGSGGKSRESICKGCRNLREVRRYTASRTPAQLEKRARAVQRRREAAEHGFVGKGAWFRLQSQRKGEVFRAGLAARRSASKADPTARYRHRRLWFHNLKRSPCTDCGVTYSPEVMEFDHLSGKSFSISSGVHAKSKLAVLSEMAKCELVCSNCHQVRTHRRRNGLPATLPAPEYHI